MTDRIWVHVAYEGRRVPIEGQRGRYFEHGKPHQVRHTPFLERRIKEGDLTKVDAPAAETAPPSAATPATELPAAVVDKMRGELLGTVAATPTPPIAAAVTAATSAATASTTPATVGAATEKGA